MAQDFLKIMPRAKDPVSACDQHNLHRVVISQSFKGCMQSADHAKGQGMRGRPSEREQTCSAAAGFAQIGVMRCCIHARSLPLAFSADKPQKSSALRGL